MGGKCHKDFLFKWRGLRSHSVATVLGNSIGLASDHCLLSSAWLLKDSREGEGEASDHPPCLSAIIGLVPVYLELASSLLFSFCCVLSAACFLQPVVWMLGAEVCCLVAGSGCPLPLVCCLLSVACCQ